MPLDGCRRFGAIEFERHDNHEKTIQLYPGTVRVREAFVLRSIEVYPWFNDLVTASFTKNYFLIFISVSQEVTFFVTVGAVRDVRLARNLFCSPSARSAPRAKCFPSPTTLLKKKRGQKKSGQPRPGNGRAAHLPSPDWPLSRLTLSKRTTGWFQLICACVRHLATSFCAERFSDGLIFMQRLKFMMMNF